MAEVGGLPRVTVVVASLLVYVAALLVNALAAAGKGPFHSSTGNVSHRYETGITPAGWTFSVWGLIYTWLSLLILYLSSYLCRGSWGVSVLPLGFYLSWISNMTLNMTWLLLWDREMMSAALVVLALVAVSNYSMMFFSSLSIDVYAAWLTHTHPWDLCCLRLLVQNGVAMYATWTSIATLINFSLWLRLLGMAETTAASVSLCVLLAEVVAWFCLENFLLDRYVRSVQTVYPVVMWALLGNVTKHYDPEFCDPNFVFMFVLLLLSCLLFVTRVAMVIYRNRKQPLLSGASSQEVTSPADKRQRKMFT